MDLIFRELFKLIFPIIFGLNPSVEEVEKQQEEIIQPKQDSIEVIIPTFLGNWERNYYGNYAPDTLNIIWKHNLGKGKTVISRSRGSRIWKGAGWTGQPLLVREDSNLFIIQGAYDHHLKKISADSGKIVWQYKFDDVVKGTGSIWVNDSATEKKNSIVILQGSRLGVGNYLDSKHIPSYRAISYFTGEELWRHDSKWERASYSRDVDASAIILNDTAYIGLENSLFTVFSPDYKNAQLKDSMLQPLIYQQSRLYKKGDAKAHKKNTVTEASPSLLNDTIFIPSGSGRFWGYSLKEKKLVWQLYIGSDIDGTAPVTYDDCLLLPIEKQFIKGRGGVAKVDPSKKPDKSIQWFFPTKNTDFASWEGGVIGSVSVNDKYKTSEWAHLAAFTAIDGNLYVVEHDSIIPESKTLGFDSTTYFKMPRLVFKTKTEASISTPIFVGNKLIAAGYKGIHLFEFDKDLNFKLIAKFEAEFEATPVVHNGRIYIASRNGYLYCFGN